MRGGLGKRRLSLTGRHQSRLGTACALLTLIGCLLVVAAPSASGAEPSIADRCIANGLADFLEADGSTFNHHPEKQREARSTDGFLTSLETDTSFRGVIADLPGYCRGSFHREGAIKLLFKTTKRGWRPIYKGWAPIQWESHELYDRARRSEPDYFPDDELGSHEIEYSASTSYDDGGTPSPWLRSELHQNTNTFGLGCTIASKARVKLLIVDDQTSAIVAARLYTIPIQVESWYLARCLGKISLEEQARVKQCPGRAVARGPSLWRVKVKRVSCRKARNLGQEALQLPSFLEGALTPQQVGSWKCYYASRGAASCERGGRRIYLQFKGGAGDKCDGQAVPAGVKSLKFLGTSCSAAAELARALFTEPGNLSPVRKEVGGVAWECAFERYFEYDDRMINRYSCFSGRAAVSFAFPRPKQRLVPTEQATMPAGVILPGQGHGNLFTLTPEIKFAERIKWTKRKILLPFTVDSALVGQRAQLKLETLTAKCEWTSDQGQTSPICPSTHRVGRGQRTLVLKGSQTINVGRRKHHGNWVYRLTISTPVFSLHSLNYRKTRHTLNFWMINAATHCERNPWCHPRKKRR